jgi:hypothetical protein
MQHKRKNLENVLSLPEMLKRDLYDQKAREGIKITSGRMKTEASKTSGGMKMEAELHGEKSLSLSARDASSTKGPGIKGERESRIKPKTMARE